jgi:hypothetical protein
VVLQYQFIALFVAFNLPLVLILFLSLLLNFDHFVAIFLLLFTDKIWSQVCISTSLFDYGAQWLRVVVARGYTRLGASSLSPEDGSRAGF